MAVVPVELTGRGMRPVDALSLLQQATAIVLVDWPIQATPECLARSGLDVYVKSGPGRNDYCLYRYHDGRVSKAAVGRPSCVDLLFIYRPPKEYPALIAFAKQLGAGAVWVQSGRDDKGRADPNGCWMDDVDLRNLTSLADAHGLLCIAEPAIADVARELSTCASTMQGRLKIRGNY
jgi:hypothetical protein